MPHSQFHKGGSLPVLEHPIQELATFLHTHCMAVSAERVKRLLYQTSKDTELATLRPTNHEGMSAIRVTHLLNHPYRYPTLVTFRQTHHVGMSAIRVTHLPNYPFRYPIPDNCMTHPKLALDKRQVKQVTTQVQHETLYLNMIRLRVVTLRVRFQTKDPPRHP